MKTSRTDIKRDKRDTRLDYDNCTMLGYSELTLHYGDCFLYYEHYTDGTKGKRLAKCHGRVRPNDSKKWFILAQSANDMMSFTYERWIDPKDVCETLLADKVKYGIKAFFWYQESINGS